MDDLAVVAPVFVEMAHRVVWCSAASVDHKGRPRSRILHPIWEWDGARLRGWIATSPHSPKRAHLDAAPFLSLNYWLPSQDTCLAECRTAWAFDSETRTRVWDLFVTAPAPLGYDPSAIPGWESPTVEGFAVLQLDPWRLRVHPGSVLLQGSGKILTWQAG